MPETGDTSILNTSKPVETGVADGLKARGEILTKGGTLRQIGAQVDKLLTERATTTKTVRGMWSYTAEEMMTQGKSPEQFGIDRQDTQTHLALLDKRTNTSFIIETHKPNKSLRYIDIRFQTLGENKGSLGGGVMRLTYKEGQQEPIEIQTSKVDNVHMLQFSDNQWLVGDPGIYGPYFSQKFEHTELSDADSTELLNRLASPGIATDTTLTEKTARNADLNHRIGHSRRMLEIVQQQGDQQRIEQAQEDFLRVQSEAELQLKMLLGATAPEAPEKSQQNEASSSQNERESALSRGIIPQEILNDPDYSKVRKEAETRLLLAVQRSNHGKSTISEDEIDKEVINAYAALAAKRAELQKFSNSSH